MRRLVFVALFVAACEPAAPSPDAGGADAPGTDTPRTDAPGSDAPGTDAPVALADVHFIGRFDFSAGADTPRFAWPGSEIAARISGTSVSVDLESDGSIWFEAWVDGVRGDPFVVAPGTATYPLAASLAAGEHEVRLIRRNESFAGTTRFHGFVGAELVPSPPPYAHLIEFVGDSITCGYGALGVGPGCPFDHDTSSEPDGYAAVAARALGVGHVSVAYSGIGLTQNYGGGTDGLMGVRYEQVIADGPAWSFSYTPEVVVVTLGTNDFWDGDPGTAFADAMDAFVQQVRGHHPGAEIFLATSPMLSGSAYTAHRGYLDDAIGRAAGRGDTHLHRIDLPTQEAADGLGCDYHPSVATHAMDGMRVAAAIRAVTGW